MSFHAQKEKDLENLIFFKIIEQGKNRSIPEVLSNTVGKLSYREKIEVLENLNDGLPCEKFNKINKYRIEFAHPEGIKLRDKYNKGTIKGKESIKNLLQFLIDAEEEIYKYYKALEIVE